MTINIQQVQSCWSFSESQKIHKWSKILLCSRTLVFINKTRFSPNKTFKINIIVDGYIRLLNHYFMVTTQAFWVAFFCCTTPFLKDWSFSIYFNHNLSNGVCKIVIVERMLGCSYWWGVVYRATRIQTLHTNDIFGQSQGLFAALYALVRCISYRMRSLQKIWGHCNVEK